MNAIKSNTFLRAMYELTEQDKEIMRLQARIEGLESRIQNLQNQLESKEGVRP